jgi:hypothetical protein
MPGFLGMIGGWYVAVLAVQGICLVHALRNRAQQHWYWIILIGPFGLGALAYFWIHIRPNLGGVTIDLSRLPVFEKARIAGLERELGDNDTLDRRMQLAELYLKYGRTAEAEAILRDHLDGPFRSHHHLLSLRARCLVEAGQPAQAAPLLDQLDAAGSSVDLQARQLLRARVLVASGDEAGGEELLRRLAGRDDGEEARWRYAWFLAGRGRTDEAGAVIERSLRYASGAGRLYRRSEQLWIALNKDLRRRMAAGEVIPR